MLRQAQHGVETKARPMQCEMRCKSRSRGLDTVFPDLLSRRSLPYLDDIDWTLLTSFAEVSVVLPNGGLDCIITITLQREMAYAEGDLR